MKNMHWLFIVIIFYSCQQSIKPTDAAVTFSNLKLKTYSQDQLVVDFELLVNSLKEAHTGLYWYSTEKQFDSLAKIQRALIKDSLSGLQFYNIVAPIVTYTKEDHCDISLSEDLNNALMDKGLFIPLLVTNLKQKPLILNHPNKGFELVSINNIAINGIYQKIFNTFASDGYIETSKYRYLDFRGFSREYAKVVDQKVENTITVKNPKTGITKILKLQSISAQQLIELHRQVLKENTIRREIEKPALLEFRDKNTAVLTFRTFSNGNFEDYNMNFKKFVDSSFAEISKKQSRNLIIDIRDNGGGSEGNEDFLFSYLTDKPYNKYKYVELSNFSFSFLDFTDYSSEEDKKELEAELKNENEKSQDGRIYRKPNLYIPEPINSKPFRGNVYILTSGWTYSGGAEFSTLMKEHTNAVFIGEETGGGYYGNTSGTSLELTLPNTKLIIDIPLLKFALDVSKGNFGSGIIPNFEIEPAFEEFINGYDAELEYTKKIIEE